MCILFVYMNNDAAADEYQVILAMNRDEFIDRPTLPAHFWSDHCVGGLDVLPGREGGTWFGASSKFSKMAALLNISQAVLDTNKCPRGHLVTDFLQSDLDATGYVDTICQSGREFNPFSLVLLERRDGDWSTQYFCNRDEKSPRKLESGVHVFGNSVIDRPWQKVVRGRVQFEQIVSRHHRKCFTAELKSDLIGMLSDCTRNMPDPVLESQLTSTLTLTDTANIEHKTCHDLLARRSAIFVDLHDAIRYGTRTHTVLLIDKAGRCEYMEKTLNSDVGLSDCGKGSSADDKQSLNWQTTCLDFRFA